MPEATVDSQEWVLSLLSEKAEVVVGGTPSTENSQYWDGNIPWMSSGDIHLRRIKDVPGRITQLGLLSSNARQVEPPTIAVALAGQGKTRGTVALVETLLCTNQSVALIKPRSDELVSEYLFHNLDFRYEELRARSSGGGRAGLTKQIIESLPIPVPHRIEQSQIAEILDTLDAAIRETEAAVAKLRQIKAGLLHDLLTHGLDDNGELRNLLRKPEGFRETPVGPVPKDWLVATLGQFIRQRGGFLQTGPFGSQLHASDYRKDGVAVVMPQDINDEGVIDYDQSAHIAESRTTPLARHRVRTGDLLFARRGDLSRCGVVEDGANAICGTGCLLFRPPEEHLSAAWFATAYRNEGCQRQIAAKAVGTTMVNLNSDLLSSLWFCIPRLTEQQEIGKRISALAARITTEDLELHKFRTLKQGLAHDLLTGRVRVKV